MTSCSRILPSVRIGLPVLLVVASLGLAREPRAADNGRPEKAPVKKAIVKAVGTLVPEEVLDIGAQVSGKIVAFGPDPDDRRKVIDYTSRVEKGTVLVQIDPAPYQTEVAIAKAELAVAEAKVKIAESKVELARVKLSRKKDVELDTIGVKSAEAQLLEARAGLTKARIGLDKAEKNRAYCTIVSPVKGVIIDRRCNIGQNVSASLTAPSLFLIARDLKRMQVWAAVKEADIGRIRVGQKASFRVDAYPQEVFSGVVSQVRLNATLTKNAVTYTVVVDTKNDDLRLLPYLTAQVEFTVR